VPGISGQFKIFGGKMRKNITVIWSLVFLLGTTGSFGASSADSSSVLVQDNFFEFKKSREPVLVSVEIGANSGSEMLATGIPPEMRRVGTPTNNFLIQKDQTHFNANEGFSIAGKICFWETIFFRVGFTVLESFIVRVEEKGPSNDYFWYNFNNINRIPHFGIGLETGLKKTKFFVEYVYSGESKIMFVKGKLGPKGIKEGYWAGECQNHFVKVGILLHSKESTKFWVFAGLPLNKTVVSAQFRNSSLRLQKDFPTFGFKIEFYPFAKE
jgi:hypothetical protein